MLGQKPKLAEVVDLKVSEIHSPDEGISFFNNSSFIFDPASLDAEQDEYDDDEDPGFDAFVVNEENFSDSCKELAKQYDFPTRAIKPDTVEDKKQRDRKRE